MIKRLTVIVLTGVLLMLGLGACTGTNDEYKQVKVDGLRLEILGKGKVNVEGIGVEWDPYLLSAANTQNNNLPQEMRATQADLDFVFSRAKAMGLQKIRIMLQPAWIEPLNDDGDPFNIDPDGFSWENDCAQTFLKILDFCEENNIKVNVVTWCANTENGYFMGLPSGQWCSAPKDLDEYVENIVYSTGYLIEEKGYTCVTDITPFNEPNWAFLDDTQYVDLNRFVELCVKLDTALKGAGLRDKVRLNYSDANSYQDSLWMIDKLKGIAEIYNTHCYDYYSTAKNEIFSDYAKLLVDASAKHGAIHVISEFGLRTTVGSHQASDIDTYSRGLTIGRMTIAMMNQGIASMMYWCLFDQYYDLGPQRMEVGLWKYKDFGWEPRPQYYSFSLLTKYTEAGSEIYPIESEDEDIVAIAFKNTDNSWTYAVVNSSDEEKGFSFTNSNLKNLTMKKYVFSESTLPTDGKMIQSSGSASMKDFVLADVIAPQSMIVYSSKA